MRPIRTAAGVVTLLCAVALSPTQTATAQEAMASSSRPVPVGDPRGPATGEAASCLIAVDGPDRPLLVLSERADRRCPAPHVIAHS
ncbi:hypothetical protein [Streptomyces bohaiensis]|uniref:Uncharacterized protein n=1 Tax=Streptomyces bohaiensis TaxID=1431344 RepID=A0ABX1CC86_9ACTN|nr:hypothetical protein [Streptomyces bohaiensis]NJQ16716.1 hypothetical protein [Streptomyces bohaiensis]